MHDFVQDIRKICELRNIRIMINTLIYHNRHKSKLFEQKYIIISVVHEYNYIGRLSNMKKISYIIKPALLCLFILLSFMAGKSARAAKSGDYEYRIEKNKITITKYTGKAKKVVIPEKIAGKTVATIGAYAFYQNKTVTNVKLPSSVKIIESSAFSRCKKLKSINLEDVEDIYSNAFMNNFSLRGELDLESAETVGRMAFANCKKIKKVVFSEDLELVSNKSSCPFNGCISIEEFEVPESNVNFKTIDGVLFNKDVSNIVAYPPAKKTASYALPDTVTKICPQAFYNASVDTVVFGSNVQTICREAFRYSHIKTMTMPDFPVVDGVLKPVKIKSNVFSNCTELVEFTFPSNMENLGSIWFWGCTSLKKVVIPEQVTSIPYSFCMGCESLSEVNLNNIDTIYSQAFSGCKSLTGKLTLNATAIDDGAFMDCIGITEVEFTKAPELYGISCEESKEYFNPFGGCKNLTKITFPENEKYKIIDDVVYTADMTGLITYPEAKPGHFIVPYGVEKVAQHAFDGAAIDEFTCSGSVTVLDANAIQNAPNLTKITIGKNVDTIYYSFGVFENCPKLEEIEVKSANNDYFSADGVLYKVVERKEGKYLLLAYPAAKKCKSFTFPGDCKVERHAFYGCKYLRNVTLPKSYPAIYDLYFINCKKITINISKNLKTIDEFYEDGANYKIFGPGCKKCKVKRY